jgi:hypothetical protein
MPASTPKRGGAVPERTDLTAAVAQALGAGMPSVVWSDCGDELVVHAAQVAVRAEAGAVIADVPVATERTGPAVLSVAILLDPDGTGVTDARPWGPPELADRWGLQLQDAVWSALATGERGDA